MFAYGNTIQFGLKLIVVKNAKCGKIEFGGISHNNCFFVNRFLNPYPRSSSYTTSKLLDLAARLASPVNNLDRLV